ncbi:hypothetical protein AVEN_267949-1, partial [Araneus ventricosus]
EDGLTEEKPKAASKRKAVDDKRSKENKRPRIQMDPRLRRMSDRKEPKMAQNQEDDEKRYQENARRAKLAMILFKMLVNLLTSSALFIGQLLLSSMAYQDAFYCLCFAL